MKNYIAIVNTSNNKLAKFQDFDSKSDADAFVAEHGGFVVDNPGGQTEYWVVNASNKSVTFDKSTSDSDAAKRVALNKIIELEGLETPRRLAESILTDEGKAWLTSNRDKIATERGKL